MWILHEKLLIIADKKNSNMKYRWVFLVFITFSCIVAIYAQEKDTVLFSIGNDIISEQEALETLSLPKGRKGKISIDEFNKVLNFYLVIHDFKNRGADTTKLFRRKLELQTFNILGNIYSAENHKEAMNKCAVSYNSFAVVKDLFVPFDPMLLRSIETKREQEKATFNDIVKYATVYEGAHLGERIISPTETLWALNRAACQLLEGEQSTDFVGPMKGLKGYHYLKLVREQENFGRYKTQIIYIADMEGKGQEKIQEAYEKLTKGIDFKLVAEEYSQDIYKDNKDFVKYFTPSMNTNKIVQEQLQKLTENDATTKPFLAAGGWYIIKRLAKENYPSEQELKKNALYTTRKPSFFVEELKEKYNVKEYPHHFLLDRDEILFLVETKAYYTKDFREYAKKYGYDYTTETYDYFLNHLLVERYKEELDKLRYQRLIDDFYFFQIRNPMLMYNELQDKEKFIEDLRSLVKKYKPVIPNKEYVESNPVFKE